MISMPVNHPDIEEFIGIKSDLNKITNANISVRIDNEFMVAVKNNKNYKLSFTRPESGECIEKIVNARDLFHKICEMNWNYAEPGMLFWDEISNHNLLANDSNFEYAGTNPCVTGDTLILTDHGYQRIADICDKEVNVWNGYEFSKVTPHITGKNQPMKKVTFSDGSVLECTNYHKFILDDNSRVEANKLNVGDKLVKCKFPIIDCGGKELDEKTAYTMGFFMGDGSSETSRDRLSIKLCGDKNSLLDYLAYERCNYCESFNGNFLTLKYLPDLFSKTFVPDTSYSIKTRLDWLSGYIDSDGTVQSKGGSVSVSSVDYQTLMNVKRMINTLGCNAWVSEMYDESNRMLPRNDGTGEYKEYFCRKSYRLLISAYNMKKLIDLGLNTHRVVVNPSPNRDASRFITVQDISDNGICDTVYCFNEPKNHSGIFNGVITAQCAEEPLPAGGSCLLGALNLSAFVKHPFEKNAMFDLEGFEQAVRTAVNALDDVLEEGLPLHPLEEQRNAVGNWRQIGLGIMGLADCLIKLGETYGSESANKICESIAFSLFKTAVQESDHIGQIKGAYPMYNSNTVNSCAMLSVAGIETHSLRNSQLLTVAPTGSISTMLGISGGIEPIFANSYTRKTQSLHGEDTFYKVYTPIVKEYIDSHNLSGEDELPKQFVVASDISPRNRINCQAAWQKWIDASISSTINLPNSATVEDVENIYMYAWERGLKGVTVYRAGCAREGILVTDETKASVDNGDNNLARGYVVPASDNLIGMKRKLMTGCGSLHCVAFFDAQTKELQETYLAKGSTGGCNNFMIGLSRMISLSARAGVGLDAIIDQLNSCGVCPSYATRKATKGDTSPGSCCPIAVGKALKEMHDELINKHQEKPTNSNAAKCPKCGAELVNEGGCNICKNCGWSKCD